ncbi:hypothetical protein [Paraclostridium sordellii]|nr:MULTISPECIES: hypothetical protein [Paeniclostridium]MDU2146964.1 hypothetical protein [Paeniclostridium sordellii]MDU4412387.1 hypothetical protein [Paeniclostridium sordellii]MDU6250127.1 hypothetical protein [Paeniclostridium sordellii]
MNCMNISRCIGNVKRKQSKVYTLIAILDVVVLGASFGIILANL